MLKMHKSRPRPVAALLCGLVVAVVSVTVLVAGCGSDSSAESPVISIAEEVLPSVVAVLASNAQGQPQGTGSGVIYASDGVIVTNDHVVVAGGGQPAANLEVTLSSGDRLVATLLGRDPISDLAVLRVDETDLPAAEFLRDFREVQVGEYAIAMGSPLGLEATVTFGIVSAVKREIAAPGSLGATDFIQTDAPISPGNSGGPLVDTDGRVIGINVAAANAQAGAENIAFAIPSDLVIDVVEQILSTGEVVYAYLGIQSLPLTLALQRQYNLSRSEGVLVAGVQQGSPASQAGLQEGDIIAGIAGNEVSGQADLYSVLRDRRPGDEVEIQVVREGEKQTLSITLGERPAGP